MRRTIFVYLLLLSALSIFGQGGDIAKYVSGVNPRQSSYDLKRGKVADTYFSCLGYSIAAFPMHSDSLKNLKEVRKKYSQKNITQEYFDKANNRYVVISTLKSPLNENYPNDSITHNNVCYIYPNKQKNIVFETLDERDTNIEEEFLRAYFDNQLDDRITGVAADSIDFVGRKIHLGNACFRRGAQSIYCQNKGQISWTEFKTMEDAQNDIDLRIKLNDDHGAVLSDTIIDVNFEFIPTKARRVAYRYDYSTLIVYYVAENIDGRYVSCVLSNYGVNKDDYYLAPLLGKVMDIPQTPDNAYYIFDIPLRDPLTKEQEKQARPTSRYFYLIRLNSMFPVANLSNAFSSALGIQAGMGVETSNSFSFGFTFFIDAPIARKEFEYFTKDDSFFAKPSVLAGMSVFSQYKKELKKDLYLDGFGSVGFGNLTTNKKKDESKDKKDATYYSVTTFSASLGAGIRYKKTGFFTEYTYLPFGSSKVKNFGNSAFRTGIYFHFGY